MQRRVLDFGIQEKGDTTEIKSVKDTQPVDTSFRDKINLAKQHARPVGMLEGRETVEFYKYMRLKPDVPILGKLHLAFMKMMLCFKCCLQFSRAPVLKVHSLSLCGCVSEISHLVLAVVCMRNF